MDVHEPGLHYLELLGVNADLRPDDILGNLIRVETAVYEAHRRQIDAWLTCVRQLDQHSFFVTRKRGTGETI